MRKRHERRATLWSLGLLAVTSASCGWLRGTVTSDTGDAAVPADRHARGMALRAESAARPRRMALVVGNARYPAAIGALRNPVRDAQLMCRTLQDLGFAVTFIQDAGVERLRGAVDRFARAVQSGDIALVYYSGHGMSVEGRNYLVPVDFEGTCGASLARQLEARALSVDQMLASLSGKNSRNVLLFDACRDNPCVAAARSVTRGLGRSRSVGDGLARVAAPPDSVIVYATDPGNTADDAPGAENSPFARSFATRVRQPEDIMLVVRRVRADVRASTSPPQTPWSEESLNGGLVLGRGEDAATAASPSEAPGAPTPAFVPPSAPTTPAPSTAASSTDASRCPEGMVHFAGGTFMMGSGPDEPEAQDHERPQHQVELGPFCLARTEVTVAEYHRCADESRCEPAYTGLGCNWGEPGRENHPINCINWRQAATYCASRGWRLPSEEEWEFAASAGGSRRYPWGDEPLRDQLCWKRSSTCAVGSFPSGSSREGLLDLAGNVWEWTSSRYSGIDGYAANFRYQRPFYVFRGGGWPHSDTSVFRARAREWNGNNFAVGRIGVRCAAAAP